MTWTFLTFFFLFPHRGSAAIIRVSIINFVFDVGDYLISRICNYLTFASSRISCVSLVFKV